MSTHGFSYIGFGSKMLRTVLLSVAFACCLSLRARAADAPNAIAFGYYEGVFDAPARAAVSDSGRLYVSDPRGKQVVVLDEAGQVVTAKSWTTHPLAVAVGAGGAVLVSDEDLGKVTVYDADMNEQYALGTGDGEFLLPNHIAVNLETNGLTYVTDSRAHMVKVYDGNTPMFTFGSEGTGDGQFRFPTGIYVSPNDEVFVVDQINDRVQVFSLTGTFLRKFTLATPADSPGFPSGRCQGIVGDAAGRLYVSDVFQGEVKVFDTQGTYLNSIGSFGTWIGRHRSPSAVAMQGDNKLFVTSINNRRVEIFGIDYLSSLAVSPASQTQAPGSNATMQAVMDATGPFTFRWLKDGLPLSDGGGVAGATTDTLMLSGLTTNDAGTYTVVLTGPTGDAGSASGMLSVMEASADSDHDGIDDSWEKTIFGDLTTANATSDYDKDGSSDLSEFLAGTGPKDPGDRLVILSQISDASGKTVLQWSSVSNRVYSVLTSTDLVHAAFSPAATSVAATPPVNTLTNIDAGMHGLIFYKIRLDQIP